MNECLVCNKKIEVKLEKVLFYKVNCQKCGSYLYERTFKTKLECYLDSQSNEIKEKICKYMKKIIKAKKNICFVTDFEKIDLSEYELVELEDILDALNLRLAHNNVIDSNYTD